MLIIILNESDDGRYMFYKYGVKKFNVFSILTTFFRIISTWITFTFRSKVVVKTSVHF